MLVHLLDARRPRPGATPLHDYDVINRELALYDPELAARPQIVALNKIDLPDARKRATQLARPFAERGIALHAVSAATGEGVPSCSKPSGGPCLGDGTSRDSTVLATSAGTPGNRSAAVTRNASTKRRRRS